MKDSGFGVQDLGLGVTTSVSGLATCLFRMWEAEGSAREKKGC